MSLKPPRRQEILSVPGDAFRNWRELSRADRARTGVMVIAGLAAAGTEAALLPLLGAGTMLFPLLATLGFLVIVIVVLARCVS